MPRLRDYILDNFWLKVFSVVMAGMIWFAVQSNLPAGSRLPQNPFRPLETRDFTRPVGIATVPGNQQVFKITPTEVKVTIRGDKTLFRSLRPSDLQVYVDLTDVSEAHGAYQIQVNAPREGVSRIEVAPQFAHVEVEKGTK